VLKRWKFIRQIYSNVQNTSENFGFGCRNSEKLGESSLKIFHHDLLRRRSQQRQEQNSRASAKMDKTKCPQRKMLIYQRENCKSVCTKSCFFPRPAAPEAKNTDLSTKRLTLFKMEMWLVFATIHTGRWPDHLKIKASKRKSKIEIKIEKNCA
jgi:hypothetical protein